MGGSNTAWNPSDKSSSTTLSNGKLAAAGSVARAVRSATSIPVGSSIGKRAQVEFTAAAISAG